MFQNPVDYIGVLFVLAIFLWRFNSMPAMPSQADEGAALGAKLHKWLWSEKRGVFDLFPPPRANTTLFKYRLYQLAYALIGLFVYLAILNIPSLRTQLQEIIALINIPQQGIPESAGSFVLEGAGSLVLAFFVAVLLPMFPLFSVWDAAIRNMLYVRAAIPAQQLRERSRLKNAPYLVNTEVLKNVRNHLVAEGFKSADIQYDDKSPTTHSLWTKSSLLMEGLSQWEAKDKYKTAFAILKERDGVKSSMSAVTEAYEALLHGDAKACFDAMREASDEPETTEREAEFRQNCKRLLDQIYDLLSRVSLHAHYSDRERVRDMNQLGFGIAMDVGGAIPGHNDLLWLAMILIGLFVIPLSVYTGLGKAMVIGSMMFVTVLIPLVLVNKFPGLAAKVDNGAPAISLQVLSAVIAMILGMLISVSYRSILAFDLNAGWQHYVNHSAPWSLLLGMVAALIAWRMQVGSYPEHSQPQGVARYKLWGSLRDSAIFGACAAALMTFVVLPLLSTQPSETGYLNTLWLLLKDESNFRRLLLPTLVSLVVGFIVPTWYRAQERRKSNDRRKSGTAARAKFDDKIYKIHGFVRRQNAAK